MTGFYHHFRDGEELVGGVERLRWWLQNIPAVQKVWEIFKHFSLVEKHFAMDLSM